MTTPLVYPARVGSYREVVLADKPTFFYEFSDVDFTSGTILDLSGNGNDASNPVQSSTPLQAVGQIGNQRCAYFPFIMSNQARIQTSIGLTYPEISVECTVASAQYGYGGGNDRLMADGHTDQSGSNRAGFEFFMPNAGQAPQPSSTYPNQGQLSFIIGNGHTLWTASTAYTVGQTVQNSGNVYTCTTAGISATSGGPTGTGTGISDGTVVWNWLTQDNLTCNSGNINLIPGNPYHLMATVSVIGGVAYMALYINGVEVGSASVANFGNVTSPYNIGVGFNPAYNGDFFNGWMGAAAAYDYGLTAAQVLEHSNAFFTGIQR